MNMTANANLHEKRFDASKSICSRDIRRTLVMDSDASFLCIWLHNDCSIFKNEKQVFLSKIINILTKNA